VKALLTSTVICLSMAGLSGCMTVPGGYGAFYCGPRQPGEAAIAEAVLAAIDESAPAIPGSVIPGKLTLVRNVGEDAETTQRL